MAWINSIIYKKVKIRIPVLFFLFFGVFMILNTSLYAQTYGLGFYSHEVSKDARTGLNLNPDRSFTLDDDFKMSFDFDLRPNNTMYFGYVFRIITEDNLNIDLIFNYNNSTSTYFTLVAGQKLIGKLPTDFKKLCNDWSKYQIKINVKKGQISFITPDSVLIADKIEFKKSKNIKILFGASDIKNFKTSDVPPMNIRNIILWQKGKIRHHWPLNETIGTSANDLVGNKKATVRNPLWIKLIHSEWESVFDTVLDGSAQVTFDSENEDILLIGDNKIIKFDIPTELSIEFTPKNKNTNLLSGRQAIYDAKSNLIYSYDIDFNSVSSLRLDSLYWKQNIVTRNVDWTVYLHHNKYYSADESSVYIFGGYGQHKYKNEVQKFNLKTHKSSVVNVSGDKFNPRYLSAIGQLNDTIYILGGYGSLSGEQILNPHAYNELMAFSLKDHKFLKKFELKSSLEDLAFANSMVIDPQERTYYALVFPVFKYEDYLQLVKGSLSDSDFTFMGNTIPYLFMDVRSYADLFFCQRSRKLIAATILTENGKSDIHLYSLSFPPNEQVIQSSGKKETAPRLTIFIIMLFTFCAVALTFIFTFRHYKNRTPKEVKVLSVQAEEKPQDVSSKPLKPYSIIFFGDFIVYDKSGKNITSKFTKLLRELFLLIFLHSLKNDTGIPTEKIIMTLWFDYSESSAHNNKAVNISKLKTILNEIGNCELSNKTGYWKIEFDENVLINDYSEFLKIVKSKTELSKIQVQNLIEILQKGTFLNNLNYDWLDEFKASITNDTVDHLIHYMSHADPLKEPEFINHIADSVLRFDSVNEEAMIMKCKALIVLGRHTAANETYIKFAKEYKLLYGSDFEKSFNDISV